MPLTPADKLEIYELNARFDMSVDENNVEEFLSTFVEDGELSAPYAQAKGYEALTNFFIEIEKDFSKGKRHLSGNTILDGDGDNATGRSYLVVFEREKAAAVVATIKHLDTYVRVDGAWKIKKRELIVDPSFQVTTTYT